MEKTYLDRVSLRRMGTAAQSSLARGRNISGQSLGADGNVETL
jgi:hypothetical protein